MGASASAPAQSVGDDPAQGPQGEPQSNISGLPIEMLVRCFVFLPTHITARLPILHVSRGWRAAAFTFPDVWSRIQLSDRTPKGHLLVDLVLSYTPGYPFDFVYTSYNFRASTTGISGVLQKHMHRMRSIDWPLGTQSELTWSSPAQLLEHIFGLEIEPIPSDFLGGVTGRLRTMEIQGLCLPESCSALSTLTRLRAWVGPEANDSRFLGRLFDLCPCLEDLHLDLYMHDTALLPRGPAPASLRRLQLSTGDIDAYYSSIDRLDVIELCSTWQVIPRIPWLDLSSSRFTDADFALVCHGAVELNIDDFASDNRAVCIVGHLSGGREYTLHMYSHSESQAVDVARYLLAYQKQGLLHALRRLTLSSHVFHLFAQKAGTLAILTELTIVFYPVKTLTDPNDAAQTYSFSWTHLSGLPPAPVLETLRVDIRNRADRIFHTKTHFPTAADALALAPIVRAALNPFERHVRVVVEGFTKEVFSTVDLASWGDVPVTFPFTAQEQGSPSLR